MIQHIHMYIFIYEAECLPSLTELVARCVVVIIELARNSCRRWRKLLLLGCCDLPAVGGRAWDVLQCLLSPLPSS